MSKVMAANPQQVTGSTAPAPASGCLVVVLWIDWYAYHVARFRGLASVPSLAGRVAGLEFVGGVGVHAGMKFREDLPADLPVESILPGNDWGRTSKWMLARMIWQRLSKLNPELVLVPGYYTVPGLSAAFWARLHGRTSVLMSESTADDHPRVAWKEGMKSLLIRSLFDWAVAGGRAHVRYLRQLGVPAGRIAGFYDVVDNRWYRDGVKLARQQGAPAYGLPTDYFLYVGRLAEEKNVQGLLQSWMKYRADGGTWPLVLVGDGAEAAALRAQAAASPYATDVHFAGHKGSREMLPYYAFAGCFVLPSAREPWGLVVNEAMASGLPVIVSSRCGCAEDLVEHGENGFVFDPKLEGELAFLLSRMEALGEGRRHRMGARSSAIIEGYSPERFGAEIARIVQQREGAR